MARLENKTSFFKSIYMKIKASVIPEQWREALVFLAFVLLAFGFWMLQSLQQEYDINISIPVRYKNIPPDIAFTETLPEKITAHVRDKGTVLLNYTFGRLFASVEVDMKNTSEGNGIFQIESREIESDILKQLMASTQLISFEPQQISLSYSKRLHKSLPVVFHGDIQSEPGYSISGEILITPATVDVYSSSAVLDTLLEIKTVYTKINKVNKTVNRILQLQKIPGTEIEPGNISISIPIEQFTEKTLEIPVTFTGIPREYTIRAFPAEIKVNCLVPLSRFKEVTEEDFAIQIPYQSLKQYVSGNIPVELTQKPDWIQTITLSPGRIEFILEKNTEND